MKTIGEILKQRRLELGYSIEDIHDKTKLSPVHLKAIEDGDLDYFRHDLSYLKFFIQYYCQAVYLDFDEIKGDYEKVLENYHETQAIKKVESTQASNENIQRRIQNHQSNYKQPKGSRSIQFKKIENQTIIVLVVVVLLAALLLFGFFKLVWPRISGEVTTPDIVEVEPPVSDPQPDPVEPTPDPAPEPTPEPTPEPEVIEPTFSEEDYANYRISNINDSSQLIVRFSADTWVQTYINEAPITDPAPQVFNPGDEIVIDLDDTINKVTFEFGNLTGTNIFVDNTEIILNSQARSTTTGILLNFHFEGE